MKLTNRTLKLSWMSNALALFFDLQCPCPKFLHHNVLLELHEDLKLPQQPRMTRGCDFGQNTFVQYKYSSYQWVESF